MIKIETRLMHDEKCGPFIRYIPYIDAAPGMSGTVLFSAWDVGLHDGREAHNAAIDFAKKNAVSVLSAIINGEKND